MLSPEIIYIQVILNRLSRLYILIIIKEKEIMISRESENREIGRGRGRKEKGKLYFNFKNQ